MVQLAINPQKIWAQSWTRRPARMHKGLNGKVLVIGGSPSYSGAPILASVAALRSGCGLVTLAAPEKIVHACNAYCPDIIGHPLRGLYIRSPFVGELVDLARQYDVVLVGNGAGKKAVPALKKIIRILIQNNTQLVLDATAFDALKGMKNIRLHNCILLPHVGEFERWKKINVKKMSMVQRKQLLKKMIGTTQLVINLKDYHSVIVSPSFSYVNRTGNPGMSKGGFGDVLAGLTAGLWAQGMGAFSSAVCAAWLNGKMSDELKKKKWYGHIASDLLNEIKKWNKRKY